MALMSSGPGGVTEGMKELCLLTCWEVTLSLSGLQHFQYLPKLQEKKTPREFRVRGCSVSWWGQQLMGFCQ